jgi:type IV pilus secretin PilQ/predicted competence protein
MRFAQPKFVQLFVLFFAISAFAAISGSNKRVDMSFVEADFQSVFHSISRLAGADILLAPDVRGTMSFSVTQKTWSDMMDIVCDLYDLTWVVEGNYIKVQRTASYQQKQISAAEKREQGDMVAPLMRRNFKVRHATASEMAKVFESIKSSRGRISVVERNNAIIAYDTERRLEQMQNTLNELDIETLQIVITAKLVVVDSRLANELGIDWTGVNVGGDNSRIQAGFANVNMPPIDPTNEIATQNTTLTVHAFDNNMTAKITNLLSDSRTEVLASPQVSTLDHTEATIFMGDEVMLPVIDPNTGQSTNQQVQAGIRLTVTPHVAGDNRILLDMHPTNDNWNLDGNRVVISRQEAKTKVVVADGETVVIGGLTRNEDVEAETGIPFLKDIPVLGYLFKHTRKIVTKKDLVIFVTPRIMRNYLPPDSSVASASEAAPVAKRRAVVEEYSDEDYDDGWE